MESEKNKSALIECPSYYLIYTAPKKNFAIAKKLGIS